MTTLGARLVGALRAKQQEGLPAAVRAKALVHIADAIGVALAARSSMPVAGRVLEALGYGDSRGGCTVLGTDRRLPPAAAAFANSAGIHILDYEDIHDDARMHPTTVTLPAALAAAELAGRSGASVVEGVALGNEFMIRMGLMMSPKGDGPASGWFLTQFFGYFGAALSAGVALGLDDDQLVSAVGLAYMQVAGGKEAGFGVGADARALYPAFAAMGGLNAALLARAGIVGPHSALDGAAGLFRIYFGMQPDDAALATLLAPAHWNFLDTDTKPWPCCRFSHPYVAVALAARERVAARPITRVRVAVNATSAKLCRPLAERRRPTTLQDAKYSIPFVTAFALVHGRVTLDTLGMHALADPAVLALASRIDIEDRLPDTVGLPHAEIVVEVPGESILSAGPIDLRMSEARIREKFFDCLAHAGSGAEATRLWSALLAFDGASVADMLRAIPSAAA